MILKHLQFMHVFFTGLAMLLAGCATSIDKLPVFTGETALSQENVCERKAVSVQYLGVGGHLFRYGNDALMTAPLITNPTFLKLASFTKLKTDEKLVDRFLPPVEDVEIILVGHSHYDHLLDVPYIMKKHATKSTVYGSKTMGHIIASAVDKTRIAAIDEYAAKGRVPGRWIYNRNRTIRFMPIESEHAPHIAGLKILPTGPYRKDLERLPRTVFGWAEGTTFAYLIDLLDNQGNIAFRIHYQDATSNPPIGFIPKLPPDEEKRLDLEILCVASFNQMKNYPEGLVSNFQPRYIILGHWEDFFRKQKRPVKALRTTNIREFIKRLESVMTGDSKWFLPLPFTEMQFPIHEK